MMIQKMYLQPETFKPCTLYNSELGLGGIARPFSTQIISVNRDVKQISVGFKKVTVEASEMTVGYMTV